MSHPFPVLFSSPCPFPHEVQAELQMNPEFPREELRVAQEGKADSGLLNPAFGDKGDLVRMGDTFLAGNVHLASTHNA